MIIDRNQLEMARVGTPNHFGSNQNGANGGIFGERYRWRYGVIPYKFGSGLDEYEKSQVTSAINRMKEQLFPSVNYFLVMIKSIELRSDLGSN